MEKRPQVAATLNAAAVQALAQDVMRASLVRLTALDLEFLRADPPKKMMLTLPHALAVQRSAFWAYFRKAVLLECLPVLLEGRDKPFPSVYLWVGPGNIDGVALVQLLCRGGSNAGSSSHAEDELDYLTPFPAWQEMVENPTLEDDSAQDEAEGCLCGCCLSCAAISNAGD
jgi:hypothetical protein